MEVCVVAAVYKSVLRLHTIYSEPEMYNKCMFPSAEPVIIIIIIVIMLEEVAVVSNSQTK